MYPHYTHKKERSPKRRREIGDIWREHKGEYPNYGETLIDETLPMQIISFHLDIK